MRIVHTVGDLVHIRPVHSLVIPAVGGAVHIREHLARAVVAAVAFLGNRSGLQLLDRLGLGMAGIMLAGEGLHTLGVHSGLLGDLAFIPVMAQCGKDRIGLRDLGRAGFVGEELAALGAGPVRDVARCLAGRGDRFSLHELVALCFDRALLDVGRIVRADAGLFAGFRAGGRGGLLPLAPVMAERGNDGFLSFHFGHAVFHDIALVADLALPIGDVAVSFAGGFDRIDFLQVVAGHLDRQILRVDRGLSVLVSEGLAAELALPVFLGAVLVALGRNGIDMGELMLMRDLDFDVRLVRRIVERGDGEADLIADIERHFMGLARGFRGERRNGFLRLCGRFRISRFFRGCDDIALRVDGKDRHHVLVIGDRHGDLAGLRIVGVLSDRHFRCKAVHDAGDLILEIGVAVSKDLLGRHAAQNILAAGQVGIEAQRDVGIIVEDRHLLAVVLDAAEHEPGIVIKDAVFSIEDRLGAERRVIHIVDLAALGIVRDHDDVARVAVDRGNHEQRVQDRGTGVRGNGNARVAEFAVLGEVEHIVAGIEIRVMVRIHKIGHGGLGIHFRLIALQLIAPVGILDDRSSLPIAAEGHIGGVRTVVLAVEIHIAFHKEAVLEEVSEIIERVGSQRDRHVHGLRLTGGKCHALRRVDRVVDALFQEHGRERIIEVIIGRAFCAKVRIGGLIRDHIHGDIKGLFLVRGVHQIHGDGVDAVHRRIVTQLHERILDIEHSQIGRRDIHQAGALLARAVRDIDVVAVLRHHRLVVLIPHDVCGQDLRVR